MSKSNLLDIIEIEKIILNFFETKYEPFDFKLLKGESALIVCQEKNFLRALMDAFTGYIEPVSGTIKWWNNSTPLSSYGVWDFCNFYRRLGVVNYQSQLLMYFPLIENISMSIEYELGFNQNKAISIAAGLLKKFGLYDFKDVITSQLPEKIRKLSLYALALCKKPELLILENPRSFLDGSFNMIWDIIKEEMENNQMTIIVFDRVLLPYQNFNFSITKKFEPKAS